MKNLNSIFFLFTLTFLFFTTSCSKDNLDSLEHSLLSETWSQALFERANCEIPEYNSTIEYFCVGSDGEWCEDYIFEEGGTGHSDTIIDGILFFSIPFTWELNGDQIFIDTQSSAEYSGRLSFTNNEMRITNTELSCDRIYTWNKKQ